MEAEDGDFIEVRSSPEVFAQVNELDGFRVVMRPRYTDDPDVVHYYATATPAAQAAARTLGATIAVTETAAEAADRVADLFEAGGESPDQPA
jgi:hypothetical protein